VYRLSIPLPFSLDSVSVTELMQCNEMAVNDEFGRVYEEAVVDCSKV